MFSLESVIFIIASIITLTLVYLNVSTRTLQQIITLLLVVILILLNRFIFSRVKPTLNYWSRLIMLLLSSLIVQLVVLSTGGFFSPFLILLHLFTLGTSFLLNLKASISFLIFSVITLIANIWVNQNLMILFKEDPFSFALYLVSFVVIIPLAQLLTRSYHIKDTISKILSENLYQAQLKEESILKGLNELVIVTDKQLKIMSVNQSVEKIARLSSSEVTGKNLLDILPLKGKDNSKVTTESLAINQMLEDKASRIIKDLYIDSGTKAAALPVTIQARPIADSKGVVNQFVFVISEGLLGGVYSLSHDDLDQAHKRLESAFEDFQKTPSTVNISTLKFKAELLKKMEEDLLTAQEIEDHSVKEIPGFPDVAEVCQQTVTQRREFAKGLNVLVEFSLPLDESIAESTLISLREKNTTQSALPVSNFSAPLDSRWLKVLIEKLLDIAIFLSSSQKNPKVEVNLNQDSKTVVVLIKATFLSVPANFEKDLFSQYFGELGTKTNLRLGSGLEGFIVKNIVSHLGISLTLITDQYPQHIVFEIKFPKDRQIRT